MPCCHFLHPFVEAVAALDLPPSRIRRILCRVPEGQEQIIALPRARKQVPGRADEARWSLPYVLALQVVRGAVVLDDFVGARSRRTGDGGSDRLGAVAGIRLPGGLPSGH
ncbi:hypothetical protein [Amycolatopsis taiwanensis]|uniref:MmgE/PrpD C-terminal domain-containing protein n=1 Tax=Amycolatopsis taiwanensis TaxID=342230 RepID=A0A9W6R9Y7_9PSEU|nr:hypothetical protein Atai01_68610 [Amycolatopsis taiwanensis]